LLDEGLVTQRVCASQDASHASAIILSAGNERRHLQYPDLSPSDGSFWWHSIKGKGCIYADSPRRNEADIVDFGLLLMRSDLIPVDKSI
jgi:hypothetical protein